MVFAQMVSAMYLLQHQFVSIIVEAQISMVTEELRQLKHEVARSQVALLTHAKADQLQCRSFLKDCGMAVVVVKKVSSSPVIASPVELFQVVNGLVDLGGLRLLAESSVIHCDECATYFTDNIVHILHSLGGCHSYCFWCRARGQG